MTSWLRWLSNKRGDGKSRPIPLGLDPSSATDAEDHHVVRSSIDDSERTEPSTDQVQSNGVVTAVADDDDLEFNEVWYLESNPGVAKAVAAGHYPSGKAHYLQHGHKEGRSPLPPKGWTRRPAERAPSHPTNHRLDPSLYQACDSSLPNVFMHHNGPAFLNPTELMVKPTIPRRVVLIGSCLMNSWGFHDTNPSGCPVDLVLVNNAGQMPHEAAAGIGVSDYDFAVIQLPLRDLCPDGLLTSLDHASHEAHEAAFDEVCARLELHLNFRMEWNIRHGLLTFVSNFLVPQRNPMGLLFPKFDIRNPEYFVQKLNDFLERQVRQYKNAYVLDIDRIAASVGRRFVQDDVMEQIPHGSLLGMVGELSSRMEPVAPMVGHFDYRNRDLFKESVWAELISMFRVVRQVDSVKLVVLDLDDTLWNGVSGDISDVGGHMVEGWPLGVAEALRYLKKRGVLLAIISKNEESRIREIWQKIFRKRLPLSEFAAVIVNWLPKTQNMQELLDGVSLLPRNVVFVDDNPVERAAMKAAFPEMRVIGRHPYYIRQTLLWGSEAQVPSITDESSRRTEMVLAQLEREGQRKQMSREEFLQASSPSVELSEIRDTGHPRFGRAFELLNKTNQYNTTGRRWTLEELRADLEAGSILQTFEVEDKYTAYGLVGVVIVRGADIVQWVMSCRILGYQVEDAVMSQITSAMRRRGYDSITGRLVETDVNFPCRTLFSNCGFIQDGEQWMLPSGKEVPTPSHVTISERTVPEGAI